MNEDGLYTVNFKWEITNFVEPRLTSLNPRMCFAIREHGSSDNYDILYKSMLTWKEGLWNKKDGFTDDPFNYCRLDWDSVPEDSFQDWHPKDHDGTYDEDK
jgi:hypothetical protein